MSNHVKNVVKKISKIAKLKNGDSVLDIASNDGTLLRNYKSKIKTFNGFLEKKNLKKIKKNLPPNIRLELLKKKNSSYI